jgi:hypothetical protein
MLEARTSSSVDETVVVDTEAGLSHPTAALLPVVLQDDGVETASPASTALDPLT